MGEYDNVDEGFQRIDASFHRIDEKFDAMDEKMSQNEARAPLYRLARRHQNIQMITVLDTTSFIKAAIKEAVSSLRQSEIFGIFERNVSVTWLWNGVPTCLRDDSRHCDLLASVL